MSLSLHRRKVKRELFERSGGLCEVCRWEVGTDYHHVYGRGKKRDDWREQPDASLLVCRSCHPAGFIHERMGTRTLELVLELVVSGKQTPYEGMIING